MAQIPRTLLFAVAGKVVGERHRPDKSASSMEPPRHTITAPIDLGCQRRILRRHRNFVSKSPHRRRWSGLRVHRFALTGYNVHLRPRTRKLGFLVSMS